MWLVRSILLFLVIVAVLVFAIGNVDHRIEKLRLLTKTYMDVHVSLVVMSSILLGALICFLIMLFREFALRNSIRKLRRENINLDNELTALRNLPLSGIEERGDTQTTNQQV